MDLAPATAPLATLAVTVRMVRLMYGVFKCVVGGLL